MSRGFGQLLGLPSMNIVKKWWIALLLLAMTTMLFIPRNIAIPPQDKDVKQNTQITAKESVKQIPELWAKCVGESAGVGEKEPRQYYTSGNPVIGYNPNGTKDWGACQINDYWWDKTAQKLGLDYKYNEEDNYKLALVIYEVQGISAWLWSSKAN